jgi:L-alanine-DL-glutamate epimerase-like enolase superfamily enzyme
MNPYLTRNLTRRKLFGRAARAAQAAALAGPILKAAEGQANTVRPVNRNSAPSDLKITDLRACRVAANYDYPLIKLYTNQGVYGLGEVRDAGVEGTALILKSHLLGRNPLDLQGTLQAIRPYAWHGRMGGGYSAIDMALHDIAGKVYNVPAYRLIGTKQHDRVRIYADTTDHPDPKVYAKRMAGRKAMGLTFFKMDLHTDLVKDRPGAVDERGVATQKGLQYLAEYIQAIREVVTYKSPLAADHFGPLTVKDAIRYGRAFEPYDLAWAEDFIDWRDWRGFKTVTENTQTTTLTGENIFGLDGFKELIDNGSVNAIHPDPETSGGLFETKKIADYAAEHNIKTALHHAGSPIGAMCGVHVACTLTNFLAMENHALDMPWWQDLVSGIPKPIIKEGYISVPETPGLGLELNDALVKEHLRLAGYFEPTPFYDQEIVAAFNFGKPWPHYDEEGKWCNCVTYQ